MRGTNRKGLQRDVAPGGVQPAVRTYWRSTPDGCSAIPLHIESALRTKIIVLRICRPSRNKLGRDPQMSPRHREGTPRRDGRM